jgi:hypothetical protein
VNCIATKGCSNIKAAALQPAILQAFPRRPPLCFVFATTVLSPAPPRLSNLAYLESPCSHDAHNKENACRRRQLCPVCLRGCVVLEARTCNRGPERAYRDGEISMNEEQLLKIGQSLQEILAELRTINAREERRDQKNSAVQDRFANL